MDAAIASGMIGGAVSVVLCTYISKSVRQSEVEGGLQFSTFLIVLAWCCFGFVLFAGWALFNDADARETPSEFYPITGIFIGFGIAAAYCFGEYFGVRGTFDTESIDFYTPWTGRKLERWKDLQSVEFDSLAQWYLLSFKSGKKIRLSNFLSGHGEVLDLVRSKGFSS